MSDIFDSLVVIICEVTNIDAGDINLSSNIIDDLGVDSIDFLDIAYEIDRKYEIKMPVESWMEDINMNKATTETYFVMSALVSNIQKFISEKVAA